MVKITTDTACDLTAAEQNELDITVIPLYINMEGQSYRDVIECRPEDLFESFERTKQTPKTAAVPPSDYLELFERVYDDDCTGIVHISINGRFSCTFQNAVLAAQETGKEIRVFDSCTLASMQGLLVLRAARLAKAGATAEEIEQELIRLRPLCHSEFMLGGLEYAARGGRCPMFLAKGANLLKLRPLMHIDKNGVISSPKKFRGSFAAAAMSYLDYILRDEDNIDYSEVYVSYTSRDMDVVNAVIEHLRREGKFERIYSSQTGCVASVHGGPETLAVFFFKKYDETEEKAKKGITLKLPFAK